MLYGVGVDIVDVNRIQKIIEKWGETFKNRIFTPTEIEYCERNKLRQYEHFGVRFAVKEATKKALNTPIKWKEIEVRREKNGKPFLLFHGKAKQIIEEKKIKSIKVTTSHTRRYAIGCVILEK